MSTKETARHRKQAARLRQAACVAVACFAISGSAVATDLAVRHSKTEAPTYLDFEPKGLDSPGDMRIFHFDGETLDGKKVVTDWIMTTTAESTVKGANSRVTEGIFSFDENHADQIIIRGVGFYSDVSNTFKPASMLTRAIVGGTGKYAGASGVVVSEHFEDGSWIHTFDFND
jgi:hypothetical protein